MAAQVVRPSLWVTYRLQQISLSQRRKFTESIDDHGQMHLQPAAVFVSMSKKSRWEGDVKD